MLGMHHSKTMNMPWCAIFLWKVRGQMPPLAPSRGRPCVSGLFKPHKVTSGVLQGWSGAAVFCKWLAQRELNHIWNCLWMTKLWQKSSGFTVTTGHKETWTGLLSLWLMEFCPNNNTAMKMKNSDTKPEYDYHPARHKLEELTPEVSGKSRYYSANIELHGICWGS